jgi:hypothetical protein
MSSIFKWFICNITMQRVYARQGDPYWRRGWQWKRPTGSYTGYLTDKERIIPSRHPREAIWGNGLRRRRNGRHRPIWCKQSFWGLLGSLRPPSCLQAAVWAETRNDCFGLSNSDCSTSSGRRGAGPLPQFHTKKSSGLPGLCKALIWHELRVEPRVVLTGLTRSNATSDRPRPLTRPTI